MNEPWNVTLNEKSGLQKTIYCMIPFIKTVHRKYTFIETENKSVLA